jgi:CheY-like chemotaxis protein
MRENARNLRILLADDDSVFCSLAQSCLEGAGHLVQVVGDGAAAIEYLRIAPCDMAIIDLSMPRVDGYRLISLIRHTPRLVKMPIMVVSSSADSVSMTEVRRLGANAYLTKPVAWATFPHDILRLVEATRAGQSPRNV